MNFKIKLTDGTTHLIEVTAATYKSLKVWLVKFKDGKEAMLYKCGNEWMQRTEDYLDTYFINAIGSCIDSFGSTGNLAV